MRPYDMTVSGSDLTQSTDRAGGDAPPSTAYDNLDVRGEIPAGRRAGIRFAFEFPELVAAFDRVDAVANRYKSRSRWMGMTAILLVLIAFLLSAADPLLKSLGKEFAHAASYVAGALGTVGTGMGLMALLPNSDRRRWLHSRLKSETLRLFHFGFMASRFPELAAGAKDEAVRARYLADRKAALERLLQDMDAISQQQALDLIRSMDGVAYPSARTEEVAVEGEAIEPDAADAFAAWRDLRLVQQLNYCDAKLEPGKKSGALNPLRQVQLFAWAGWVCIAAVVSLHIMHLAESWLHMPKTWLHVGVMWAALTTLGLRALEGGLQSDREVERYEQYRANVVVAMERFDAAESLSTKVETMRAFERMSLEEMRVFLRTHARSNFLL
jgi:hypothetical protein